MSILVAVYGTLKRGLSNHALLQHASFVGEDYLTCITLYDLSLYDRRQVLTKFGLAWIYLYNLEVDQKRALRSGAWQPNC